MRQILIVFLLFHLAYGDSAESLFEKIASKDVLAKYTTLLFDNGCRPALIGWDKECIKPSFDCKKANGEELSWIKIARAELGVLEIKGAEHNPRIIQYHSTTTGKFQDDETPWCSSFVNWVITQAGLKGTNSARAASWKDWGQKLDKPAYGCIGVIVRANGTGHVTFIVGKLDNKKLVGLGGNQANSVKYSEYPTNNFKAFVYPNWINSKL